jgi:hypothetical protein
MSVHLIITIQKVTMFFKMSPRLQTFIDTRLKLKPSAISISNHIILVSEKNYITFASFLYYNHQVHRDILLTLCVYIQGFQKLYTHTYITSLKMFIHCFGTPCIYTRQDNKFWELIVVKVLRTSLLKTIVVAFTVLPFESYAPMPAPSPPFKQL